MDDEAISQVVNKIPHLKHKFLGVYAANNCPLLRKNSFAIINNQASSEQGQHWITIANKNGVIYFGDSMGEPLETYKEIYSHFPYKQYVRLIQKKTQSLPLCGLYTVYFAWCVFTSNQIDSQLNDFHLMRFMSMYL